MAEACLGRDPVMGRRRGRSGLRGTNQTGRRDAVCTLRDRDAGLAGSGGGCPGQSYTVLDDVRAARRAGKTATTPADMPLAGVRHNNSYMIADRDTPFCLETGPTEFL